jgi:hypothetical protein
MRACSKEYSNRDETGREKYVSKIGKKLKRKNGMVSFQENVTQILTEIYSKILKNKDCKNILAQKVEKEIEPDRDTYEIIFEIVTLAHFEKEILQTDSDSKDLIEKTERFAEKTFSKLDIDEKRRKFCIDKLVSLVGKIAKQAGKSEVGKIEVNNEVINILSEKLNRDIYFLDENTRLPFSGDNKNKLIFSIIGSSESNSLCTRLSGRSRPTTSKWFLLSLIRTTDFLS